MLKPKLYSIFFLGFASGVPFLLILSTLSVWLAEVGISNTMIGLLAWVSIPYTIKFVWGAMVDNYKLPVLYDVLGKRRSWMIVSQVGLWISLTVLGYTNPTANLWLTALVALMVGCFSAIQDITVEAYRIEMMPDEIGTAASASVLGYRFGMLCSGAGTIFLAAFFNSWSVAYSMIGATMLIGIIASLCSSEPIHTRVPTKIMIWKSVKVFVKKLDWQIIIPFVLSYKIADTVLNTMSMPFLVDIGFNKLEIASVAKTFGISAMIIGGFCGGVLLRWQSIRENLLTCVILQCIASALFVTQAKLGHDISFLFLSMGVENFTCGMSQVALISYLSHLSTTSNTAMHYAILSSFASFVRVCFSSVAGWMADQFAWSQFYAIVCVSTLPSLIMLVICARHFINISRVPESSELEEIYDGY